MGNLVNIYDNMKKLGITLPPPLSVPKTLSLIRYLSADTLYLSGVGPSLTGQPEIHGKVPCELSEEAGYLAARSAALNALALLEQELGDLNRVTSFVKQLVFVACDDPAYSRQHIVANGSSDLLIELFGAEIGKSARSAIGVYALPGNIPVEIEMIVAFK